MTANAEWQVTKAGLVIRLGSSSVPTGPMKISRWREPPDSCVLNNPPRQGCWKAAISCIPRDQSPLAGLISWRIFPGGSRPDRYTQSRTVGEIFGPNGTFHHSPARSAGFLTGAGNSVLSGRFMQWAATGD
jgi:hypothetical protein